MEEGFAHRLGLDRIHDGDRCDLVASEEECRAVAERLGLLSLHRLEAHVAFHKEDSRVQATGRVKALLTQPCVATGEPVESRIDEPFDIRFLPEPAGRADEEVELESAELDCVFHDGAAIDLGAAVADTLALALDPYPRSPGAEAALRQAGVMSEDEAGPFAALAALKERMGK